MRADVDGFVGVDMDTDSHLMGLALLAVEDEGVRLFGAAEPVGDGLEGLGAVEGGEYMLYLFTAVHAVTRQEGGADDELRLFRTDALIFDLADLDLLLGYVGGVRAFRRGRARAFRLDAQPPGDGLELVLMLLRAGVALRDDVVYARGVEGQHRISCQLMLEKDICHSTVGLGDVSRHEGDVLHRKVGQSAEVGKVTDGRHLGADDDIGSHGLGQVDREIVARASVAEHHALETDGTEVARDGHGGTHGVHDMAGSPVLLVEAEHVGGYAIERYRELVEAKRILVSDRYGTEGVADVEAEEEAVRKTQADLGYHLLAHVSGTGVALFVIPVVSELLLDPVLKVLVVIVERDADREAFLVATDIIGLVAVRDLVRHHHCPVDSPDKRVEIRCVISERIEACDQAAHAGTSDQVDGDAHLFHVTQDAEMRHAARTSSAQDHRHGGAVPADGVHARPHT